MQKRFSQAGGIFIAAGVIGGFVYGASRGEALKWAMAGLVAGVMLALLLWLVDRRR